MSMISITTFKDVRGTVAYTELLGFEQIEKRVLNPNVVAKKENLELVKLCSIGDKRTSKNSLRHDENITSINGVEIDYDGGLIAAEVAQCIMLMSNIRCVIYTTPSHSTERPRWRILVPTSRAYPPADRRLFVGYVNNIFNGAIASESFTLSQSFYIGRVQGAEYEAYSVAGLEIDLVQGLTARYPETNTNVIPFPKAEILGEATDQDRAEALRQVLGVIENATKGEYHKARVKAGKLLGGYIAAGILGNEAREALYKANDAIHVQYGDNHNARKLAITAIDDGIRYGEGEPLTLASCRVLDTAAIFGNQVLIAIAPEAQHSFSEKIDPWHFPDVDRRGKPQSTIENLQKLMDFYGISCHYDEIKKTDFMIMPGVENVRNDLSNNGHIQRLKSLLASNGINESLYEKRVNIMMHNTVNPIRNWITGKPWDGISRIQHLINCVDVVDNHKSFRDAMMRMWLLQCVAAMDGRKNTPNKYAKGKYESVLVFFGAQGTFKTSFIRSLVPAEYDDYVNDGLSLNPDDKDSVKKAISSWICELGELDATFRSGDIAKLKAFLSESYDELRLPYMPTFNKYERRTSFTASVNHRRYLIDRTGNRRFVTINVIGGNPHHNLDMQQVWAEVYSLYITGEQWWPTPAQAKLIEAVNNEYTQVDYVEDAMRSKYNLEKHPTDGSRITCSDILKVCEVQKTHQTIAACKNVLEKLGFERGVYHGKHGYRLEFITPFGTDKD